jgi:hypothetical protein
VRLLVDSRGVEVPMAYKLAFEMLSSLMLFFFKSLKKEPRFSDNAKA